jgi:FkbM family methyltransferase
MQAAKAIRKASALARLGLRQRLLMNITVRAGARAYTYRCSTFNEYRRALSLTTKEPGTFRWITSEAREGDVFYDVGANMGIYTIPAAQEVGDTGMVYAFEPHGSNLVSLLTNVSVNGLEERVGVLSCALHDSVGVFDFTYQDLASGSSLSQLQTERRAFGAPPAGVPSETKLATTVDDLVAQEVIRPPTLVKIDVDGNELLVLRGMRTVLTGNDPPRAVLVEVNADERDELPPFLADCGYQLAHRDYTPTGRRMIADGQDPESVHYNGIFRPAPR